MTPIYHITHVANLTRILAEDGLHCDAEAERRGLCAQSIAYDTLTPQTMPKAVRTWRWGGKWLLGDPDIIRRKQAEFLVHARFPWSLFHSIGVLDAARVTQVREAIADASHKPRVTAEPKWYYNY